jgi:hypothetical protein
MYDNWVAIFCLILLIIGVVYWYNLPGRYGLSNIFSNIWQTWLNRGYHIVDSGDRVDDYQPNEINASGNATFRPIGIIHIAHKELKKLKIKFRKITNANASLSQLTPLKSSPQTRYDVDDDDDVEIRHVQIINM